jgi:hypothetical protein
LETFGLPKALDLDKFDLSLQFFCNPNVIKLRKNSNTLCARLFASVLLLCVTALFFNDAYLRLHVSLHHHEHHHDSLEHADYSHQAANHLTPLQRLLAEPAADTAHSHTDESGRTFSHSHSDEAPRSATPEPSSGSTTDHRHEHPENPGDHAPHSALDHTVYFLISAEASLPTLILLELPAGKTVIIPAFLNYWEVNALPFGRGPPALLTA